MVWISDWATVCICIYTIYPPVPTIQKIFFVWTLYIFRTSRQMLRGRCSRWWRRARPLVTGCWTWSRGRRGCCSRPRTRPRTLTTARTRTRTRARLTAVRTSQTLKTATVTLVRAGTQDCTIMYTFPKIQDIVALLQAPTLCPRPSSGHITRPRTWRPPSLGPSPTTWRATAPPRLRWSPIQVRRIFPKKQGNKEI